MDTNAATTDHFYVPVVTHMTADGEPYGDTEFCLCCGDQRPIA